MEVKVRLFPIGWSGTFDVRKSDRRVPSTASTLNTRSPREIRQASLCGGAGLTKKKNKNRIEPTTPPPSVFLGLQTVDCVFFLAPRPKIGRKCVDERIAGMGKILEKCEAFLRPDHRTSDWLDFAGCARGSFSILWVMGDSTQNTESRDIFSPWNLSVHGFLAFSAFSTLLTNRGFLHRNCISYYHHFYFFRRGGMSSPEVIRSPLQCGNNLQTRHVSEASKL